MIEHSAAAAVLVIGLGIVLWGAFAIAACILEAKDKKFRRIPKRRGHL